jgi:hypothetical protein
MAATQFVVHPEIGAVAWIYVVLVTVSALIAAAKGRFGWLALGIVTGGLGFVVGALGIATPDSLWARALYGPERMARARSRFPRRLPHAL